MASTYDESVYWARTWDGGMNWTPSDLYRSLTVDGPSTNFTITETKKKSSTYNGSFGMSVSALEAKVGFQFGEEEVIEWTDSVTIPANQRMTFNLYTK